MSKNRISGNNHTKEQMNLYSNQHAILDSTLKLLNGKSTPIEGGTNYGQKDYELALERLNLLQKYCIEYKMYEKMNRIEKDFV